MAEVAPLLADLPRVADEAVEPGALDARLTAADRPFVMRGVASDWPLVAAGKAGSDAARRYILAHARQRDFTVLVGRPGAERVFSTLLGAMQATSFSLASALRTNTMRAGHELALVGPHFISS